MITNWNDSTIALFRRDLEAAIDTVLTKHGLINARGIGMRYTTNSNHVKFEVNVKPENFQGKPTALNNHEAQKLTALGVPLGTKLRSTRGDTCTVIGYNQRSRKYPVQTQSADGQAIAFPSTGIQSRVISYPEGYTPPVQATSSILPNGRRFL